MSHENPKPVYAEGTRLDAILGIILSVLTTLIIFAIVFLLNNGNTPPSWTGN